MNGNVIPGYHVPEGFIVSPDVADAFQYGLSVVALESTVITHGLPYPQNLQLAKDMETEIRGQGAVPATIAILDGKIHIGLTGEEVEKLASAGKDIRKISRRDFGIALARKEMGGTTVAGTLIAAKAVGIRVFATGGIGGVHRDSQFDISADLPELSRSPLVVVCAGAKSILDLPATLEYLETMGIPIVGYGTGDFPAFYSESSGLPANVKVDTPDEAAAIARAQWNLGLENAVLVVVPPPSNTALPRDEIEGEIHKALASAASMNIRGAAITPFLLSKMSELSGGKTLATNLALLRNNARVAAKIAISLYPKTGKIS